MKKKLPVLIGGLLAAVVLIGVIGASIAYAQEGGPGTPAGSRVDGDGPRGGHGLGDAELKAAAAALNMTTDELSTTLKAGKTLEQLASDAGVDLQTVQDAIKTAHADEIHARIKQGVTDGTISQAKADWLLEGLDKGYLDGPGFGFGFGGPHWDHGQQRGQPDATPTP